MIKISFIDTDQKKRLSSYLERMAMQNNNTIYDHDSIYGDLQLFLFKPNKLIVKKSRKRDDEFIVFFTSSSVGKHSNKSGFYAQIEIKADCATLIVKPLRYSAIGYLLLQIFILFFLAQMAIQGDSLWVLLFFILIFLIINSRVRKKRFQDYIVSTVNSITLNEK